MYTSYDQQINPIKTQIPDRNKIEADIQCQMKMDGLPDNVKKAYEFKKMQEPLVSIPVICDNGCEVTFITKMYRYQKGTVPFKQNIGNQPPFYGDSPMHPNLIHPCQK